MDTRFDALLPRASVASVPAPAPRPAEQPWAQAWAHEWQQATAGQGQPPTGGDVRVAWRDASATSTWLAPVRPREDAGVAEDRPAPLEDAPTPEAAAPAVTLAPAGPGVPLATLPTDGPRPAAPTRAPSSAAPRSAPPARTGESQAFAPTNLQVTAGDDGPAVWLRDARLAPDGHTAARLLQALATLGWTQSLRPGALFLNGRRLPDPSERLPAAATAARQAALPDPIPSPKEDSHGH